MKGRTRSHWSPADSAELYGLKRWGNNYFSIDEDGNLCAHPEGDDRAICVLDVLREAKGKGLGAPIVIRFQDLLRRRVQAINEAFAASIAEERYTGRYRGVFPIKVNQLREVVEEIAEAGSSFGFGLEAGSKPELLIALAMLESKDGLLICNGYKDADYIRLALFGAKLGKQVVIVAEQLSEVQQIVELAREISVAPMIGFRAKLNARGEGKWALSTGDQAKFGLTTTEMIQGCQLLETAGFSDSLKLLHFHIGSQVPNIITIKNAVVEATRFYCQLKKMGFPMGLIDVGGGLGIDYDGSSSNWESSANYTLEEYARDIVFNVKGICQQMEVECPDIVSESGRAITAAHSVLVTQVVDTISKKDGTLQVKEEEIKDQVVRDLFAMTNQKIRYGQLEKFHDALQKKEEAFSLFNLGFLDLKGRAQAESLFWQICQRIDATAERGYRPEELDELKRLLADQYICNFSVFQSLLDHWALDQLFPILPLHRLGEKPTINAILADITCDSDGKVSKFIDLEDEKDYLPLHPFRKSEPYYLGIFLVGAYQDIMGDNHNLFGRVNEVHVFLEDDEDDGFYIEDTISGSRIKDVVESVQFRSDSLCRSLKKQVDRATKRNLVKPREGVSFMESYERQLQSLTYLNLESAPRNPAKKRKARSKAAKS